MWMVIPDLDKMEQQLLYFALYLSFFFFFFIFHLEEVLSVKSVGGHMYVTQETMYIRM